MIPSITPINPAKATRQAESNAGSKEAKKLKIYIERFRDLQGKSFDKYKGNIFVLHTYYTYLRFVSLFTKISSSCFNIFPAKLTTKAYPAN